ncbi:hypothetical protein ACQCP0_05705 [Ralstonia pseudosolanacearum]|uniref:Uncharacterized protein n=4 Tax=Ralstonia solanacearum species complex TaxID=3116862 RepID=A0A0S4U721_RALSL|nr:MULTISPECIES: hypothetical protein [Ralstonia]APF87772.1 hypothetical protein BCR16_13645 [Ralstonia solanacearum FJAT-1458]ARS55479.1 hypothetical protein BC427_04740 [Ralstonia solanacearum FJAT-91]AVV67854.1 hypothetical protein RSOE_12615 [Ralstonia solanacearum OE1-1]AXV96416.1 hypothetical protein CJO80_13035 [Ralstonia solanacearum]API75401.1 hypothetical protein AC251_13045 [Ralstonia pseudosolanacearum]
MKIYEAIKFFGLPPSSKLLGEYLNSIGISERPSYQEVPVERINKSEEGFSLVFEAELGYRDSWGQPRESGDLIFCSLQVYSGQLGDGFAKYAEPLPFGLTFESTLSQAESLFGGATTDYESGGEHVYVWYNRDGFTISISFLPGDKGISFFDIEGAQKKAPKKLDW